MVFFWETVVLNKTMVVAQICTNLPHTFASVLDPPNKILIFLLAPA